MRGGCASTQAIVAPHFTPTLMTLHGAHHCTKILTAIQIENWTWGVKQREHGLRADDGLCRPRHYAMLVLN